MASGVTIFVSMGFRKWLCSNTDDEGPPPIRITNQRMLSWFYRNLAPYWKRVSIAVIAMLAATAAGLATPLVLKHIFDDVITARDLGPLPGLIVMFLLFTVATQGFGALRTNLMHLLGQRFVYNARMECYRHLLGMGMNYFERERSGDIISRISNDVDAVERMVVHGTDDIISNVLHIGGAIALLFWLDWRLALVALAPMPIFVCLLWAFARFIRPVFSQIRRDLGEINARIQERIGGIQVIKAYARETDEVEFFDKSCHSYYKSSCRSIWMWSTFFPCLALITSIGLVLLVWVGARLAADGPTETALTVGTLVAFLGYMQQFYRPIGSLARVQNMINQSLAAIARIFELMDETPSVVDRKEAIELNRINGCVALDRVSFAYDTGETVLRQVSVTAAVSERIAIVGPSGAGKTSLINLIARFYDPQEGQVLIDGIDICRVKQTSLRRHIGMVLQETILFNTTVRENILYAKPEATDGELICAAKGAHAHEFICRLPEGYETVIGERGVRLSGGEKQRLSIARAFLSDPCILILDEATSMVDNEAEMIIQKALDELMCGRTTFIIAHRLSTVRMADKIIVLDDGRVVEQGTHESLMRGKGLYHGMVSRQVPAPLELEGARGTSR